MTEKLQVDVFICQQGYLLKPLDTKAVVLPDGLEELIESLSKIFTKYGLPIESPTALSMGL